MDQEARRCRRATEYAGTSLDFATEILRQDALQNRTSSHAPASRLCHTIVSPHTKQSFWGVLWLAGYDAAE